VAAAVFARLDRRFDEGKRMARKIEIGCKLEEACNERQIKWSRQSRQLKDRKASAGQVAEAGTMSVALKKRGSEALGEPTENTTARWVG